MTAKMTKFIPEDDNLRDVLANLDLVQEYILENKMLVWAKIDRKTYGYIASNIPKQIVVDMLRNGFSKHLLYEDIHTYTLKPLTEEVLELEEFQTIHQVKTLISTIYVVSHEAMILIVKKLIKIVAEKK